MSLPVPAINGKEYGNAVIVRMAAEDCAAAVSLNFTE